MPAPTLTTARPPSTPRPGCGLDASPVPGLRVIRLLAKGGFAEVWEAEQVSLGRRVALKILRHEHLGQEQMVSLFEQEAKVLARLNHPNVVQVIDRGKNDQGPYFVMEFVEGETLQGLLSKGRLTRERALTILLSTARALAYAHRNQVVHRDVKPANILIARTGQVKLTDFGIAAVKAKAGEQAEEEEERTGKRQALGTRAYMAPEQRVSFDEVGPEADVYSLGVILHRILTGKLPPGPGQVLRGTRIPERLQPILERSLSGPPGRRYPDAGAFREALVNGLEGAHIDDRVRRGAVSTLGTAGRFELLDVIRQDERRSVYLVSKGGAEGERIVVKRYVKNVEALRTVRNLIRIEHPNVVRIHAVGERDDSFIMLMEHLPGGDLRERLVKEHPWRDVASVGLQVARALAATAAQGIVHGNLRPSNILFDAKGKVRVTDFGLPEHYIGESKRNWYAPPEGGRSLSGDLYCLGATLYEMLFAQPAPEGASAELAERGSGERNVPRAFLAVLRRLLAPVDERYEQPGDVVRDLEDLLDEGSASKSAQGEAAARLDAKPQAASVQVRVERKTSYVSGLVGLGGLVLVWLLQLPAVQRFVEDLLAP